MQKMWTHLRWRSIHPINQSRPSLKKNKGPNLILFKTSISFISAMDTPDNAILAVIKIELNDKLLGVIETALVPEAETPSSDRSKTEVIIENNYLVIKTYASDTTALRASLNSYLRWVDGIQNIVESIE